MYNLKLVQPMYNHKDCSEAVVMPYLAMDSGGNSKGNVNLNSSFEKADNL